MLRSLTSRIPHRLHPAMSSSLTCVRLGAWTLAAVLLQILGLSLFMFAFFPTRPALSGVSGLESYVMPACDSADFPEERDLPPHELRSLYNEMSQLPSTFDRLILMVVDGLPAEFILGKGDIPSSKTMTDAMPYTYTLLSSGRALAYHAKAAAPTVTMPRLKAIVSGGIGGFLDVAFNFNTQAMLDDNLIDQFYRSGLKMVMLGDETWIKLFPGKFTREDGVSSFYVKDTVEVDFNVSRHLKTELAADDWSLLILHYLGLDHVGHIGGRNSVLMAPKLKEMDDVIMMIDRHTIMHQNDVNKRTLLVVVSDHGMTDHGNHGGSSYEETDCLALFVGLQEKPASSNRVTYKMINQVDIAPTLALLFGLPIPRNNVGVLIQKVFDHMADERRLRALELNSWQLLRLLQAHLPSLLCQNSCNNSLDDVWGSEINSSTSSVRENLCFHFSNAVKLHNFWRVQNGSEIISKSTHHVIVTVEAYSVFLRAASEWLSHAATNKPVIMMFTGVSIMAFSCGLLLVILFLLFKEDHWGQYPSQKEILWCRWNEDDVFVSLGTLIHVFSLGSSSLVEEEQYTWHFLTSTLYLLFLFQRVQSLAVQDSKMNEIEEKENHNLQRSSWHRVTTITKITGEMPFICKYGGNYFSICPVLMVLVCMRVLRSWHQGGVNWTQLPDISKLLEEAGTYIIELFHIASLVFVISLSCLALCFTRPRKCYLGILILSQCVSALLVFLHILDHQGLVIIASYFNLNSLSLFYGSLIVNLTIGLASPWFLASHQIRCCETKLQVNASSRGMQVEPLSPNFRDSTFIVGVTYTTSWCLLQLLLQRPINAFPMVMLFLQILASMIYFSSEQANRSPLVKYAALYFMGMTGHFGLGNNNTLAGIDVAGAFKGTSSQSTVVAGIMMFIITYASPLLHLVSIMLWISVEDVEPLLGQQALNLSSILQKMLGFPCLLFLGLNSVSLTGFTIILLLMRDHLFVWSVFSPKYLYVCAATVSVYIGLLLVAVTVFYVCAVVLYGPYLCRKILLQSFWRMSAIRFLRCRQGRILNTSF